jgi:hypothetical protein
MDELTISKPGMQSIRDGCSLVDLDITEAAVEACLSSDSESAKTGVKLISARGGGATTVSDASSRLSLLFDCASSSSRLLEC